MQPLVYDLIYVNKANLKDVGSLLKYLRKDTICFSSNIPEVDANCKIFFTLFYL